MGLPRNRHVCGIAPAAREKPVIFFALDRLANPGRVGVTVHQISIYLDRFRVHLSYIIVAKRIRADQA